MKHRSIFGIAASLALALAFVFTAAEGQAITCTETVKADVVVFDTPVMFNRLGAQNPNWITYALRRDVVPINPGVVLGPGNAQMRKDKRIRPLVLRVNEGQCLEVTFQNLLAPAANPFALPDREDPINAFIPVNDQVAGRWAGFHVRGLQIVGGTMDSDAANVGYNASGLVRPNESRAYTYYAPPGSRGTYLADSYGAAFGGEATAGNTGQGMFAAVNVEPAGARWYRSQVTEEDLALATFGYTPGPDGIVDNPDTDVNENTDGQPILDYEALYPNIDPWITEGKANTPILNMRCNDAAAAAGACVAGSIVHSDLNAVIAGPNPDGAFPRETYPLEKAGKQNPSLPYRLEAFREFTVIFHDENSVGQAFPGFFDPNLNPVTARILHGVRDTFMINYGSGGVGAEIIANRLGVGPMWDCLTCAYEEFFLSAFTVADPAMLVDVPANAGLETCGIDIDPVACAAVGPKASVALYPDDPSNVHHSYAGDRVVFRNVHAAKEQHIFHLHNHQWLFDANDDNSNYLDAQGIGPGSAYTYELNFAGSGNRNRSSGDAIFHCHFYPHFAQGMWEMWRIHDVYETGTRLDVTMTETGFHTVPFALWNGTPALHPLAGTSLPAGARVRALPDGEILDGTPIPAVVPLPGKALPPMPGDVAIVQKNANPGMDDIPATPDVIEDFVDSSQAYVIDRTKNPGYPFWIAGVDCGNPVACPQGIVGQRPPTPPLDMLTERQAAPLRSGPDKAIFERLNSFGSSTRNGGWDGGLPRHALDGFLAVATPGTDPRQDPDVVHQEQTALSFDKVIHRAKPVWFPEEGTDLEKVAMRFHATRNHPSTAQNLDGTTVSANFVTNGGPPQAGAPFFEPCVDDQGKTLFSNNGPGMWFGANPGSFVSLGTSPFNATNPRVYKGANIQIDAVFNKLGYHYPQQRIISLWEDVVPFINKTKPPEVFVIRSNTLDCTRFLHTNLVPRRFEVDDYEITTPTDIIGQHIHLPKWDLPSADGSGNGWNYEDGTLSPGSVQERILAITHYQDPNLGGPGFAGNPSDSAGRSTNTRLVARSHPFFGTGLNNEYLGARTTIQRWFFDPVLNIHLADRGLGIIFTHDHYGPSTFQQVGLYASVLTEPRGSVWKHNETGARMYTRADGGPTSWQAAIEPGTLASSPENFQPYREFHFQYSDFQHAYEAGVYVGAGPDGRPQFNAAGENTRPPTADTFRFAVNPPVRANLTAPGNFPDVMEHPVDCLPGTPGLQMRPCPEAISADDPGFLVVNYRNEPVGWRVYDPNKLGPDGKPGTQAGGLNQAGVFVNPFAGDLGRALESRNDRAIPQLNNSRGDTPYAELTRDVGNGDPFTPIMRAYAGDLVRVKVQAGGDEHEHNIAIHGVKWLQGGSGHGRAPNSGWRSAQNAGISEQFSFAAPVVPFVGAARNQADYAYNMENGQDGWWSGTWGLIRTYNTQNPPGGLYRLPSTIAPVNVLNASQYNGVCPVTAPVRTYDITAVPANDILGNAVGAAILSNLNRDSDGDGIGDNEGGALNPLGGTLVYNPRNTPLAPPLPGGAVKAGPLHDPAGLLYVHTADLTFGPGAKTIFGNPVGLRPGAPPVEPIVLRANAGECVQVTLRNALLDQAVDANGAPVFTATFSGGTLVSATPVFLETDPATALCVAPFADADLNGVCDTSAAGPVAFDQPPDLAGFTQFLQVVPRDKGVAGGAAGVTWFNSNLVRPSSIAGLQPQLVAFDVTRDAGTVVGQNGQGRAIALPGLDATYRWYAGDVTSTLVRSGRTVRARLDATPVEFGASNLFPADRIKQGQKGLIGALVVEPEGAWPNPAPAAEPAGDHQQATDLAAVRETRASATVGTLGAGGFRDFVTVFQKGLSLRYGDGSAVENLAAEGPGVPEDSHDSGMMAINYRTEPMWFRFGLQPHVPLATMGLVPNAEEAYSNRLLTNGAETICAGGICTGDPVAPIFKAGPMDPVRFRVVMPTGAGRGTTFHLHGNLWQRAPYVCPGQNDGLGADMNGKCNYTPFPVAIGDPFEIGSRAIGHNPIGMYLGQQESVTPAAHFDIVPMDYAGGRPHGDHLFRDQGSFGNTHGLWGIMRVE